MLVNVVTYTFRADQADDAAGMLAQLAALSRLEPRTFILYQTWTESAALEAHYATEHFMRLGANGIRPLAESRVAHKCTPLIG